MSIFEDTCEVYQNATRRVSGPREIDTVAYGVSGADAPASELVVVLDWESAYEISDRLGDDVHVSTPDHVVREHVELATNRIGQALAGKTIVCGTGPASAFGVVIHPDCVTYNNEILFDGGVVGIDWEVSDQ